MGSITDADTTSTTYINIATIAASAQTSATSAATSATSASTSATSAANSATAATTSASSASTQHRVQRHPHHLPQPLPPRQRILRLLLQVQFKL